MTPGSPPRVPTGPAAPEREVDSGLAEAVMPRWMVVEAGDRQMDFRIGSVPAVAEIPGDVP